MIKSFNPPGVWAPFGAFSMGVVQGEGQVVYLKGQVSLDPGGKIVGKGDMPAQVRQVLENIQAVLGHVGGTMADIVSLTQYVTDIEAFMAAGAVRKQFFAEPFPVTTTVEVARLYERDLLVEITAIAVIPRDRFSAAGL
ncbi:RidA family protein [Pelagibius litoralis]|uniref:RidA family protein n=1 Tax=Pelagibius litoralis TaxID=374515 RepID=A0A967F095_9PROT|nr:RidA family protein [Pelagibius litoralis]NIA70652.1 RidA family protein [Pelagibius litoralis]